MFPTLYTQYNNIKYTVAILFQLRLSNIAEFSKKEVSDTRQMDRKVKCIYF